MSGWCAVALGLGANNSALEQLLSNGVEKHPPCRVDDAIYRIWRQTSPRKSEVLDAYARSFRSVSMSERLDEAMGTIEDAGVSQKSPDSSIM